MNRSRILTKLDVYLNQCVPNYPKPRSTDLIRSEWHINLFQDLRVGTDLIKLVIFHLDNCNTSFCMGADILKMPVQNSIRQLPSTPDSLEFKTFAWISHALQYSSINII